MARVRSIKKKPYLTSSAVHSLQNPKAFTSSSCCVWLRIAAVFHWWFFVDLYPLSMSKHHSELTQREQDMLKFRRDSDTKAAELVKMEKMLEQTKSLMEKKREPAVDCTGYQENMGEYNEASAAISDVWCVSVAASAVAVEDLEEKVRSSRRYRRNSLHHTQMLESQMKTVRGELVGTLDHLQELRNVLRRSQQKAEERKAAMEKLAAGMR